MSTKTLKRIAVDEKVYLALKERGKTGESFNDVLNYLLGFRKRPLQYKLGSETV